jgi:DNA-binding transcriptional ArsR family regulator
MYGDLEGALSMARETEARLTLAQARIVLLPSRIRIMRALAQRRSTVTELSKRTGIAKSTVLKHLRVLKKHSLVLRNEEDRLWIYYDLTRAGRAVGKLDPLRILVLFASLLAAGLLAGAVAAWRRGAQAQGDDPWHMPPIGGEPVEPGAFTRAVWLAVVGGSILAAALATWLLSRRRLRNAVAAEDERPTDTSSSP